jgi:hypothetical protein
MSIHSQLRLLNEEVKKRPDAVGKSFPANGTRIHVHWSQGTQWKEVGRMARSIGLQTGSLWAQSDAAVSRVRCSAYGGNFPQQLHDAKSLVCSRTS